MPKMDKVLELMFCRGEAVNSNLKQTNKQTRWQAEAYVMQRDSE